MISIQGSVSNQERVIVALYGMLNFVQSMPGSLSRKLRHLFADLTDVTLPHEGINSIPTDNANRAM